MFRSSGPTRTSVAELHAPDGTTIRVQTFPRDGRLLREVAMAWERLAPDRSDMQTFRLDLQLVLRGWYPLLAIQAQEHLAALPDAAAVWYVFRDGAVGRATPWRDRVYGAMADARETQDSVAETLRRAQATLEAASRPRPARALRAPTEPSQESGPTAISG